MNSVSVNISLPQSDIPLMRMLVQRMGWRERENDALFDPESGRYLNEETMQAIRDMEEGNGVMRCSSIDELLATL